MRNHIQRKSVSIIVSALLALAVVALLTSACGKETENSSNKVGEYRKSLNVANETAAVRTLQTIYRAQTEYMLSHAEEYGTFDQLIADNYLDRRFAGAAPVVEGYVFTMKLTPKSSEQAAAYSINADPKQDEATNTTGARHLYMDSNGNVVHANARQPATANDPPTQ